MKNAPPIYLGIALDGAALFVEECKLGPSGCNNAVVKYGSCVMVQLKIFVIVVASTLFTRK